LAHSSADIPLDYVEQTTAPKEAATLAIGK
jgi:hypothetical protein